MQWSDPSHACCRVFRRAVPGIDPELSGRVGVRDSRELYCWILADQLRRLVFQATMRSSFASHPWLRSQLQRSAASACSNIAEGFSRFNPKDFARFLTMSKGSLSEVLDHLDTAVGLGLMSADERASMASLARRSRAASTKLIRYLKTAGPRRLQALFGPFRHLGLGLEVSRQNEGRVSRRRVFSGIRKVRLNGERRVPLRAPVIHTDSLPRGSEVLEPFS